MIITDKFVMLNFPKTGSSFARAILKKVHRYDTLPNRILRGLGLETRSSMIELKLPVIHRKAIVGTRGQHGTYRQIPEEHKHKTIVSIARNPFHRYVSGYLFGWWKTHPPTDVERLKKTFPHFPDLSFREHYEMNRLFLREYRLHNTSPKIDLGTNTVQFIHFYFEEPEKVFGVIDDDYIEQKMYLADMPAIVFLHQENLNRELYEFLVGFGYPEEDIGFIIDAARVNATSRKANQLELDSFYTTDLVEDILEKDKLLFELFPEYKRAVI